MSGPFLTASLKPFSHAGMNSRGIEPPLMSSTNSKSVGCSAGSGSMKPATLPYWPEPPVCFLCV